MSLSNNNATSEDGSQNLSIDISSIKAFIGEFAGIDDAAVRVLSEDQKNVHSAGTSLVYYISYGTGKEAKDNTLEEPNEDVHIVLQIARSDMIKVTLELFQMKPMSFGGDTEEKETVPIPFPKVLKTDVWRTETSLPEEHSYVIFNIAEGTVPLSSVISAQTPPDSLLAQEGDRRLGSLFSSVHKTFNLWYGIPSQPADWSECISWQECFTALFHTALMSAERAGVIDKSMVEQLQRAMFHAVAYFLFDDVEVPSLVHNPGLEWGPDIFVSKSDSRSDRIDSEGEGGVSSDSAAIDIVAMYDWTNALWGDPLMECALRKPSKAFLEGYGEDPILFERQETKKLWYLAYAALTSLVQKANSKTPGSSQVDSNLGADSTEGSRRVWDVESLKDLLLQTAEKLKDAPCY